MRGLPLTEGESSPIWVGSSSTPQPTWTYSVEDNERAYRLYQRLGYQTNKQRMLYGKPYFHMVKPL
jgi:hypothetical protein